MSIVKTEKVIKRYGDLLALDHVDLTIEEGELIGLLGPNGAGKSTLINILTSLIPFDSGKVEIFGKDIKRHINEIKPYIGIIPQELSLYPDLSAYENVAFFASLYGFKGKELKEQVKQALEFTGLWERCKEKPKNFSGGMKRRLNIACGIAHRPKLIIMDEPTVGIDPQSRNHILDSVRRLNKEGATVIYTTHYMEEVESLCRRVEIIDQGKVIVNGTISELKNMLTNEHMIKLTLDAPNFTIVERLKKVNGVKEAYLDNNALMVVSKNKNIEEILLAVKEQGVVLESVHMAEVSLEDVFLTLTGRTLRD